MAIGQQMDALIRTLRGNGANPVLMQQIQHIIGRGVGMIPQQQVASMVQQSQTLASLSPGRQGGAGGAGNPQQSQLAQQALSVLASNPPPGLQSPQATLGGASPLSVGPWFGTPAPQGGHSMQATTTGSPMSSTPRTI